VASISVSGLTAGTHQLFAEYVSNGFTLTSSSPQVAQVIDSVFKPQTIGTTATVNSQATPTGVQLVFNAPLNPNTVGFYGPAAGTAGLPDPPLKTVSAAVAANGKVPTPLPANTNIPAAYTAGQRVFLSGVTADTRFFGVAVVDSTAGSGTATPTVTL